MVRKLGSEKKKYFEENFDKLVDHYRLKANTQGLTGDLKFTKEKGQIVIFVEINTDSLDF